MIVEIVVARRGKLEARAALTILMEGNPEGAYTLGQELVRGEWLWVIREQRP